MKLIGGTYLLKGISKENFLIMRIVMEPKKNPIVDCYKTAGDKIYDFWTCNFTHPQGMFLPSLTLSQEFSLTVLLREVTEEPQLLSARQESVSKLFSHGNKILNIY